MTARFPTDATTLAMLRDACTIGPHSERTSLHDFLDLFGVVHTDHPPPSEHEVIVALVDRITALEATRAVNA